MKRRIYIAVLLFAVVLGGCEKVEYSQEIKKQVPIDFVMVYKWLGQPYEQVYQDMQQYVHTETLNISVPQGTLVLTPGSTTPIPCPVDMAFHSFSMPNYGEGSLDYLISADSNFAPVGTEPYVETTRVSKVHENATVYHPSDEVFIGIILNIMKPTCGEPGVGIRAYYDYWMANGKYIGTRDASKIQEVNPRNPYMVKSERLKDYSSGLLNGSSISEWWYKFATPYELKMHQAKLNAWIEENGGIEAVVKAQIRVELYSTPSWTAFIDWVDFENPDMAQYPVYDEDLSDNVEFKIVSFNKTFQKEGWKWQARDGSDSIPAGYQNAVFDARIDWKTKTN